jgi:hypothetical protein
VTAKTAFRILFQNISASNQRATNRYPTWLFLAGKQRNKAPAIETSWATQNGMFFTSKRGLNE